MCKLDLNNNTNNRVEQDKWIPLLKGIQIQTDLKKSMMLLHAHAGRNNVKMHSNQLTAVIFNAGWTLPCLRHSGILLYLCDLSCCSILKSGREINIPHYLSCVYLYAVTTTQPSHTEICFYLEYLTSTELFPFEPGFSE